MAHGVPAGVEHAAVVTGTVAPVKTTSATLTTAEWPTGDDHAIDAGARLRTIRTGRRRTLKDVAVAAGVSESFLSQVERGRVAASVASLRRICDALGIGIHDLFTPDSGGASSVTRMGDQQVLRFGEAAQKWLLTPQPMHGLEVIICEFEPGGHTGDEPYVHGDSEELCVVLEGDVELRVDEDRTLLSAGDAARYRSSQPHATRNMGDGRARVLYAVTPPTY